MLHWFPVILSSLFISLIRLPTGASFSFEIETDFDSTRKTTYSTGESTFGYALDTNHDFNGDGFNDILASASDFAAAYLLLGASTVPVNPTVIKFTGVSSNLGQFATGCQFAGDVNKDGYADIIFGSVLYSGGAAAYLVLGGPTTPATYAVTDVNARTTTYTGEDDDDGFDGYDDFVVCAPGRTVGTNTRAGACYLLYGGNNLQSKSMSSLGSSGIRISGSVTDQQFGNVISAAGDINNDGYADLLVANFDYKNVFLIYGGKSLANFKATPGSFSGVTFPRPTGMESLHLGFSMSRAGDFNGDGFDDLVIASVTSGTASVVYVIYGGSSLPATFNLATFTSSKGVRFYPSSQSGGWSVSGGVDINRDGFHDIVIGAAAANRGYGAAHVVFGSNSAVDSSVLHLGNGVISLNSSLDSMKTFGTTVALAENVSTNSLGLLVTARPLSGQKSTVVYLQDLLSTSNTPSTAEPTINPSATPSKVPSSPPTFVPTTIPTDEPTVSTTVSPTVLPSLSPTATPTVTPTFPPTSGPTFVPSITPGSSVDPTVNTTFAPSFTPSNVPSVFPTVVSPSVAPTVLPTWNPSTVPTVSPTNAPAIGSTFVPSVNPTFSPTANPSALPTYGPTVLPTWNPSTVPTVISSVIPTTVTMTSPSVVPTGAPTVSPTQTATIVPSATPTLSPTQSPPLVPTASPTVTPTEAPTIGPSFRPSAPTYSPSAVPTATPTTRTKGSIIVNAGLTVNSVNGATLSPTSQETIKQSIANASQTTVNNVDLVSVTRTNRRLLSSGVHRMLATALFSYKVIAEIHFNLIDFPGLNESYVAGTKSKVVMEAVKAHEFDRIISFYATINNATQLMSNATVSDVIVTTSIVPAPDVSSEKDSDLSDGQVAALVVGITLGAVLVCGLCYFYWLMGKRSQSEVGPSERPSNSKKENVDVVEIYQVHPDKVLDGSNKKFQMVTSTSVVKV
jgi:hypothetical protein